MEIVKELFGTLATGEPVFRYWLQNKSGMRVAILSCGGIIQQLWVPDRAGHPIDVVAGFDRLEDYGEDSSYQGALIGRFANRIAGGRFTLDGREYSLPQNEGENHLHGGTGFHRKNWQVTALAGEEPSLLLSLVSEDGEAGYPGNLDVTVRYTLTRDNALQISYRATTDKPTVVSLTNHAYFNLGGFASGGVESHRLWLAAHRYLPVQKGLIPTGEVREVAGTPFDFRVEKPIGADLTAENVDLHLAGGYDHCLVFPHGEGVLHRGTLYCEKSGIEMKLYTDQPCVQFYTGNFLSDKAPSFKGGCPQRARGALCLETGKMPDSPHHPHFTNTVLRPNEVYEHTTRYAFSVRS